MSRVPGSRVVAFATWLPTLLGAGPIYVSFDARYRFKLTNLALCGAAKEGDE
jgi:hypothetical protein